MVPRKISSALHDNYLWGSQYMFFSQGNTNLIRQRLKVSSRQRRLGRILRFQIPSFPGICLYDPFPIIHMLLELYQWSNVNNRDAIELGIWFVFITQPSQDQTLGLILRNIFPMTIRDKSFLWTIVEAFLLKLGI